MPVSVTDSPHLIDGFRLTPTLYKENSNEGGRTHAAFAVYMRIPFAFSKAAEYIEVHCDLAFELTNQLNIIKAANAGPKDASGRQYLANLGIPATYASSFKELAAFLDAGKCNLLNLKALGALIILNSVHSTGDLSSVTMRYGPVAFESAVHGNYRQVAAAYTTQSSLGPPSTGPSPGEALLRCLINTERATAVLRVGQSVQLRKILEVEITRGHLEIEFTLTDRRITTPRIEAGNYGDS